MIAILRTLHAEYLWPTLLVVAALYAVALIRGLVQQGEYGTLPKLGGLALLILMDLQLLVGLVLYGVQQRWSGADVLRSYEHPFQMIVAVVVFHVGYRQVQNAPGHRKKLRNALSWMVAALLILGLGLVRIKGWMGT